MPQQYDPTVWSRYTGDPERPRRRRTQYDPGVWSRYAAPAGAALAEPDPEPQPRRTTLARALGNIREMFRTPERAEAPEREPFGVRSVQRNLVELARRYPVPGMIGVGRGFETTPIEEVPPEERNILQDFVAGFESGRRATLRGVGTTLESLGLERVGRALREGREPLPNLRPRERTGNRFVDVLRETAFDVGSGVATTVPSIVGGVVGTAVGGPVGGAVGALAPAAGITYGGLREELEEEGVDPQTASRAAAVVTPLSSALEVLVPLSIGRRLLGGAGQQAARGLAREIARGALREGRTEAVTEAAQTALERAAVAATTPQEFFSRETLDQILRAARAGGLTGGLLGGAATAVGDIGPSTPAVDSYLAELERLQRKYGDELQGLTPREAQGLERLARRVAEEAGLGEEVLEPIRAEERPPREGRFSRFRRRIAEAISPELRREATEDPLTGLANRGADERATSEALRERAPGTRTVRFRVDLDNFKALNDTMGHAAGDEALRTVASALRGALREGDAVSVARPGGDEFAITLRVAEGADPSAIRDRLEEAVNRALEEAGLAQAGDRTVSASIGFAEARSGMSAEELDRLADQAAIARKRERGVSRPREEAAPAPAEPSVVPGVRIDEEASASADMDAAVEEATEGMAEPATAAEPIDVERVPTVEPERARPQNAGDVGLFPISEIRVDPKRFQFKADTDPETGAGAELKSVRKFDPVLAGVIQVWRDPADGQVYVVNGHHRLELARRLGEQEILVRFIEARDAGEARLIGAMTNIAEGRGTAIDAAKIFREQRITPEELERRGISLRGAIARDGMALANLPQKLFDDVVARRLSIPRAAIIGGSGLSEDQQLALAKLLEQRKNITNEEAAELVRFVKSAGETEVETIDLFGPQVLRQSLALEKAELSAYVKKQLAQDRRLFGYVGRGRRAQRIEGEGAGRIDVERAQAIAQQAAQAEEIYNRLSTSAGPISDALNAAAARLAAGEKADVVKRELYDQVRDAIAAELQALQRQPAALAVRERPLQPDLFGRERPLQPDLFGEEPQAELVQGELFAEGPSLESPRLSEAEQGARQIVSLLEGKVRRGAASKAEVERYEAARKLLARSQKISAEEMAAQARRAERVQPIDRDTADLFAAPPEARQPEPTETERPRIGQRTEPEEAPAAVPATPAADLPIRVSPDDIPYQVAYDAYRWNSFTPERRARQTQDEYVRHIEAVYEDLAPLARTEEQRRVLIDELERYRRGYVERELELLRATSRTASPMVTGPARFPVDRNRKALERVQRLTREFIQWRDRAIDAMRRKVERAGQEDIDPLEAARRELAEAEALQEHMKRANAIMRRSGLSDEQKRQAMREAGIPDDLIQEAFTPDPVTGALGFGRYRLKNNLETNNARIRRLRQRLEELERRATRTTREIRFDGGRIVENAEADRLQIFFDSVPSQEIRNQLKSRGFRWSPREGAWQRQLTNQARWAASSILGVEIPAQDRPRIGERRAVYTQDITQTPEFRRWFGNSKVVDEHGRPLVVYHGTTAEFDAFERRSADLGFHAGSPEAANAIFESKSDGIRPRPAPLEGRRIMPLYMRIENPLRVRDLDTFSFLTLGPELERLGLVADGRAWSDEVYNEGVRRTMERWAREYPGARTKGELEAAGLSLDDQLAELQNAANEVAIERLEAMGYDGLVYENRFEGGGDTWVAFRPEQIKSAIGNRGTFDPTDPSIIREGAPLYGGDVIRQHGVFTNPAPVDWNQPDNYYGVWTADRVRLFTGAGPDAPVYRAIIPADELTPSLVEAEDAADIRGRNVEIEDYYYDEAREILERHARSRFHDPELDEWRDFLPIGRDYDARDVEDLAREIAAREARANPVEEEFQISTTNPPPPVVRRRADGSYEILDGNHRIALWQELGYDGIPAWVIEDPTRGAAHETAARYEPLGALEGTKVVDENGEPKVVYHGTMVAFEEFDERLADPGALFGPGFYFTEDAAIASTYTTKYHPAVRRWSDEEIRAEITRLERMRERDLRSADEYERRAQNEQQPEHVRENLRYVAQVARIRAETRSAKIAELRQELERPTPAPNVRPARLAIRNPFDVSAPLTFDENGRISGDTARLLELARQEHPGFRWDSLVYQLERVAAYADANNGSLYNAMQNVRSAAGEPFGKARLNRLLQRAGYDGITHIGGRISGNREHRVWIAFRRDQIRSAFGPANRATVVGERRNRRGTDDQLELTFGSVDEAKRVVRDIAEEAGDLLQISIPGVPTTKERIEAVKKGREAAFAWVPATGQRLRTRDGHLDYESMFRLLRVYRHPAAEYWHVLVVAPDEQGQMRVVHHRMSSSGAIDTAFVHAGDIVEAGAIARRLGGRVVLAHNHPSGDPFPSVEDRDVTLQAIKVLNGIGAEFGGHFVINHEVARVIQSDLLTTEIRLPADPDSWDWNIHDRTKQIVEPESVADYLSALPFDEARVDVLLLNTQHEVIAFEPRPIADLDRIADWLPGLQRETAAPKVVIGTYGARAYERAIRAANSIRAVGVLDVVDVPSRASARAWDRLDVGAISATTPSMMPIFEEGQSYGTGAEGAVPGRPGESSGVRAGRFARRVREGVPGAEGEGARATEGEGGEGAVGPTVARGRFTAEEGRRLQAAAANAPIVRIRGDEFGTFAFNPIDIQHARNRAEDYLRTHVLGTSVVNEATGDTIHFNLGGIRKTLSHAGNADQVRSLIALPELMRNAVHVTREPNRDPAQAQAVPWVHTYAARLQIGDRIVPVRLTVKEARDGRRFYDHVLLTARERALPRAAQIQRPQIKAPAIRVGNTVYEGSPDAPHADIIEAMSPRHAEDVLAGRVPEDEFGFVTTDGDFLTRSEASDLLGFEAETSRIQSRGGFASRPRIGERRQPYLRAPAPPEPAEARTPLLSGWAELKAQALAEGQLPPRIRGFASERLPDAGPIVGGTATTAPRPSDIQRRIQEGLQIKIGIGRFGSGRFMRSVLGLYKPGPRSIRLARYGDIATLGHELGHDMHALFFGLVDGKLTEDHFVFQPWRDELERLAVGISDQSLVEGWAEFWRRYIDNPDVLPERAPKLLAYVEERLERDFPALKTLFEQVQRDWRLYREASPQARIRAQISTGEEERNLGIRDHWRRFRTDIIDDIEPIRHVVEKLTGTDRPQDIQEDAATLARLVRGSMGTAEVFLEHGVLDFRTLRKVGPSLREVFEPVLDDLDDFRDYMVARRAQELHARDITTGIRPDDADWVVRELEKGERGARFKRTFDRLQEYNRGLLKYLVDAGVMSRETMQKILETNQNYVPFYRVIDDQPQKGNPRFSLGFGHLFSPVKRIKGSGRDIIDPIESLIKNTYLYVHIAARQQVSNALARLAERHGAARFIERIPAPMVPHRFRLGEIETQLEKIIGKEPLAELRAEAKKRFEQETAGMQPGEIKEAGLRPYDPADEILMFFRPGDYFGKPNIISVLQDGRRVWYEVDPELYAALEGLHAKSMDALVRLLSAPARTLRAGAILAPEFMIRNPARDQLMAFVQSEYGFKPGVDFVRGLFSLLRKDDYYWRWKAAGGENAALVAMDRKAMRQNVERLLREGGVRNVLKDPLDVLRAISEAMENATRLGEFRRAVRAEGDTKAGLLRAAMAAREISTDFARHGAKTEALRQIAAFWNARIQGYDRLVRALRRDPVGAMTRIGAGITLPSIILYAINRDDPEYWELPQWQRDLFWHVKIGGTWLRIPKPFELGIVFGTIPERILEWIESHDPEGLRESLKDFLVGEIGGTVLPSVTAVLPLIENLANYSLFFRRPIVPRSMQDVEPRFQATERTSEIAQLLGRWTNVSPMKIDNLLYGWTGGLGRLASQTVGVAVDLARDPERTLDEISAARPEDVPGVRGVVSRAPGFSSESVERFYRRLQEARSVRATANHLEREERFDEADAFLDDPRRQELLAQLRHLERVADRLAQLRAQAAIIERDPSMPAAQKKREIEELGREAMELAREAIERRTPAEAGTR